MIQTDEEIKKEFKERYIKSEIYNPLYVDWFPDDVMNFFLQKFHTLQEEYKRKIEERKEWYSGDSNKPIRDEIDNIINIINNK